jgi:hypothetical protein
VWRYIYQSKTIGAAEQTSKFELLKGCPHQIMNGVGLDGPSQQCLHDCLSPSQTHAHSKHNVSWGGGGWELALNPGGRGIARKQQDGGGEAVWRVNWFRTLTIYVHRRQCTLIIDCDLYHQKLFA